MFDTVFIEGNVLASLVCETRFCCAGLLGKYLVVSICA
jgi:hypothetical protein